MEFRAHGLHQPFPFATESFDLVVSGSVLKHLRDLQAFFSEMRRVLGRNGRAVVSAMHSAMFLWGAQARFRDPSSGDLVQPGSIPHSIGAFVMAAVTAGFSLSDVGEFSPDEAFVARYSRANKYLDWPMLVVLSLGGSNDVAEQSNALERNNLACSLRSATSTSRRVIRIRSAPRSQSLHTQ